MTIYVITRSVKIVVYFLARKKLYNRLQGARGKNGTKLEISMHIARHTRMDGGRPFEICKSYGNLLLIILNEFDFIGVSILL